MTRIPMVHLCEMTECGFNEQRTCHAAAIQVGDAISVETKPPITADPRCDTYTRRPQGHLGAPDFHGQVGSCKIEPCAYNDHLRCTAETVDVGLHETHADCRTFRPRT